MSDQDSYHNHKETMSQAGLAVGIAFVGAIAIWDRDDWPPTWVPELGIFSSKTVAFGVAIGLWYGIHLFIRWQLRKQIIAGTWVSVIGKVLGNWASGAPTGQQLEDALKITGTDLRQSGKADALVDLCLLPSKRANLMGREIRDYPSVFVDELQKKLAKGRPPGADTLVSVGSLLLGLILAVATWPSSTIALVVTVVIFAIAVMAMGLYVNREDR